MGTRHRAEVLLIPGTSSPEHLGENLAAAEVQLDSDALDVLANVAAGPAAP